MRLLLVSLLLLSTFRSPTHWIDKTGHADDKNQHTGSVPQSAPTPTPAISGERDQPTSQVEKRGSDSEPHDFRNGFGPPTWSNWALFIVGVGTAIFAFRSLPLIRRQTKATEDAAKAALLNAQAVIHSERPWVTLSIREEEVDVFSFHLKNVGRTPAEILHVIVYEDRIPLEEKIPDTPPCKNIITLIGEPPLLAPGEPWEFDHLRMSGIGASFDYGEDELLIKTGSLRLLRYGIVTYRNTLDPDKSHLGETKFCCTYNFFPKGLEQLFLPRYSGYT